MDEVNPKDASRVLDIVYKKALDGIPRVSPSVDELVDDYVRKNPTPRKAAWALCDIEQNEIRALEAAIGKARFQ